MPTNLDVKVTRIKDRHHCRLFQRGKLIDEMACACKSDIGWTCREMLRWFCKLGGIDKWAESARRRHNKDAKPVGRIWYGVRLEK